MLFVAATLYYLVLDVPLGVMMAFVSALCVAFGQWTATQSTFAWLVIGVGLFLVGWVFQFIGHVAYEHRKPAFVDDVIGLLIGPLFVLAEALFGFGWRPALREAIEAQVGPTRINADRTGGTSLKRAARFIDCTLDANQPQLSSARSERGARYAMPSTRPRSRSECRSPTVAALSVSPSNVIEISTSSTGST